MKKVTDQITHDLDESENQVQKNIQVILSIYQDQMDWNSINISKEAFLEQYDYETSKS